MTEDDTHLNSLAIAHYVVGGMMVLFACFPLIHMFVGLSILTNMGGMHEVLNANENAPPPAFGWLFFIMGLLFFLFAQAISISVIVSGRFLKQRKNYLFSFILACLACAAFPFGTILGIFTIIVLSRPSVKAIYGRG
jgi:hypothetical protein